MPHVLLKTGIIYQMLCVDFTPEVSSPVSLSPAKNTTHASMPPSVSVLATNLLGMPVC